VIRVAPAPAGAAGAVVAIRTQQQVPGDKIGVPVSTTTLSGLPAAAESEESRPASPPDIVAGTALRAARLSARLTQAQLGEAVGVDEPAVASWEDGTDPLTAIPYPVLARLESELTAAGSEPDLVHDLTIAIWCDLVITAIADSQEISCLLADPTTAEEAFGELLGWSAGGQRPERYRPYAGPGPLLQPAHLQLTAGAIRALTRRTGRFGGQSAA
jgi:transcriptional regulator with XRE-family HTH domain